MIKAVLLDLDETLLRNPPDTFANAYMKGLVQTLLRDLPQLEATQVQGAIGKGIEAVMHNQIPLQTNAETFYAAFLHALQLEATDINVSIQRFLQEVHPALADLTATIGIAPKALQWLHANDYATAIATHPVFPQQATAQRLEWAGLRTAQPWLVTVLDNVHFSKPNPAYYEEVLSRIGFEPDEALMVGDDWEADIVPAAAAGLNTFWIRPASTPAPTTLQISPDGSGTLETFYRLISEDNWLETQTPKALTAEQIYPRMLGNVAALDGIVRDVPDHYWHQRPDHNEWSPIEVLVHLLESECGVQRPRLQTILEEDNPFLTPPPTPPEPGSQNLSHVDPHVTMQRFAEERQQTLALLSHLSEQQWVRPARHSVFGPTSLLEMAAFTARHDRLHLNQLCQTIGKCQ